MTQQGSGPELDTSGLVDLEPSEDRYIGQVFLERYRIVRKLGGGGMGAVYEAVHTMIGKRVAIKLLHAQYASNPNIVRRFMNEARAAAMLGHPHIIDASDMGRTPEGEPFLVLEFLDGRDAEQELQRVGPFELDRTVRVLKQVCSALAAAHAKGIIHRDLKLENIYLLERGDQPDFVKVLDFGISKFNNADGGGATKTGTALGTPMYMAPEQLKDASRADERSDVYSVGVMMYRLLSGANPYEAETLPGLMLKVMMESPTPLGVLRTGLTDAAHSVVRKAMERAPADRFANMDAFSAALDALLTGDTKALAGVGNGASPSAGAATMGGTREPGVRPSAAGSTLPSGSADAVGLAGTLVVEDPIVAEPAKSAPAKSALAEPEPAKRSSSGPLIAVVAVALGLGAAGLLASRRAPPTPTPAASASATAAPTVMASASAAAAPSASAAPAEASAASNHVHLEVTSSTPGASVAFRGQSQGVPFRLDFDRGNVPEPVEVSAPGFEGRRYRLTMDQPRRLDVVLRPGHGMVEATDTDLRVALGLAPAAEPAPAALAGGSARARAHATPTPSAGAAPSAAPTVATAHQPPAPAASAAARPAPSSGAAYQGPRGEISTDLP